MKKILLAYDGSEISKKALEEAKRIGVQNESEITVLTVAVDFDYHDLDTGVKRYVSEVLKSVHEMSQRILEGAAKEFADYPNKVDYVDKIGGPGSQIVTYANDNDIDLIVMGSRGLGVFKRTFLGSVSNYVLNHTEKSVYIVK